VSGRWYKTPALRCYQPAATGGVVARTAIAANQFVTGKEPTMKNDRIAVLVLKALLLIALTAAVATARRLDDSKYRVFCANGKVEVEQRTLEQEKNARGSNVCVLAEFDYLSDAEKYAENHGGKGSDCNCR
jgi:cell division protein FtsL